MRWKDLPGWEWRGPTDNEGAAMVEQRGVVLHIAEGYYNGTIEWCKNPQSDVSAHFVIGRGGRIAQLIDTDTTAWTQMKGNGHWLSTENEGFTLRHRLHQPGWERLTDAQVNANAAILAHAHRTYGVPIQIANNPTGRGLGHHSMGADWGHDDCPGPPIIAQKQLIIARAAALLATDTEKADMRPYMLIRHSDTKRLSHVFALFGNGAVRWIGQVEYAALRGFGVPLEISGNDAEMERIALSAPGITHWPPLDA